MGTFSANDSQLIHKWANTKKDAAAGWYNMA
jgi:hypothetical protein